jgi:mono/diheme cytochrome c family protein
MNIRRILPALAAAFLVLVVRTTPAVGQAKPSDAPSQTAVAQGKDTFREYCASCHGNQGKGNGPASSALKVRPADLTTIAKRKGGFPAAAVETAIKGSDMPILAHGAREMPVWGPYFTAVERNDTEAQLRVTALVRFIESIQVK